MNAHRNFKANNNTENESQAAFLSDWLGTTAERVLESHKRSEADKEEGRCETHKDCQGLKQAAREIHIKDILILAVRNYKLRTELEKVKGNDNTEDRYVEAGNTWDLENASWEAYKQRQTLTKENIHTISFHKSKVGNKASSDSL